MEETKLYQELADLEQRKKDIEAKITVARDALTKHMNDNGLEKAESEFGTFYFVTRKKWTYSPEVKAKESEVKALKKAEEENGKAKSEETSSLCFRAAK